MSSNQPVSPVDPQPVSPVDPIAAGRSSSGDRSAGSIAAAFLRNPAAVGAIAASGPQLADRMTSWIDWQQCPRVVEFGPGTGVFTEVILRCLPPGGQLIAIERDAALAQRTQVRCPGAIVVRDNAENVQAILADRGIDAADAIICGLPWASFPDALQHNLLSAMTRVLRPGGCFATFAYWQGLALPAGRRFARRLRDTFPDVQRSRTAWRNLPPAFVYRCRTPNA